MNSKYETAKFLLSHGSLYVHLDPRRSDVRVPSWFRSGAHVVLEFGYNLPIGIPDLRVTERGISGTLSFSRTPYWCDIPWSGVFGLVGAGDLGWVWDTEIPAEVRAEPMITAKLPTKLRVVARTSGVVRSAPRGILRLVGSPKCHADAHKPTDPGPGPDAA